MPMTVECPACEHCFAIPEQFAGKQGKCPECGTVFRASPHPPAAGSQAAPKSESAARPRPDTPKFPTPRVVQQRVPTRVASAPPIQDSDSSGDASAPSGLSAEASTSTSGARQQNVRRQRSSQLPFIAILVSLVTLLIVATVVLVLVYFPGAESETDRASRVPESGSANSKTIPALTPPADGTDSDTAGPVPQETATQLDGFWNKVAPHVFQIEVTTPWGVQSGTGFLIDPRGWLATSHVLFDGARSFRALPATDTSRGSAGGIDGLGLVATDPELDLAIVAIDIAGSELDSELPFHTMPPAADNEVIAAAVLPEGDAWLAPGRILAAAPFGELSLQSRRRLQEYHPSGAENATWIEHSTIVDPKAGGGPLLTLEGEVVGMNIAGRPGDTSGYAIPISRVIKLLSGAGDTLLPLDEASSVAGTSSASRDTSSSPFSEPITPRAGGDTRPKPATLGSVDYMKRLSEQCRAAHLQASQPSEYEAFQELAEYLTAAQYLLDDTSVEEGFRVVMDAAAQDVLVDLSKTEWPSDEDIKQLNEFAAEGLTNLGNGLFAYVEVKIPSNQLASVEGKPSVLFELIGTDQLVVVVARENPPDLRKGTRWLLLGRHDTSAEFMISPDPEKPEQVAQLVRAKSLISEPEPVK